MPLFIHGCVYVIMCQGTCKNLPNFYIGSYCALDPYSRFQAHLDGFGARFTQKFVPLSYKIVEYCTTSQADLLKLEEKITHEHIVRYGFRRVRGGNWVNMRRDCYKLQNLLWLFGATQLKIPLLQGQLGCPDPD